MSDDVALAALAAVAAVIAAFRLVGARYLARILDKTDVRPSLGLGDQELHELRSELERLRPMSVWIGGLVVAVTTALVVAAGVTLADLLNNGPVSWPKLSLVAVSVVWLISAWFIVSRCRLVSVYLRLVEGVQRARNPVITQPDKP